MERNMMWLTRPATPTNQGLYISKICNLLATVIKQGEKYIYDIIKHRDYWLDSVRNKDQVLEGISHKISKMYGILCTNIPYETTVLWCIYIMEFHIYTGVPAILEFVVRNTPMVAYLVGDEIYPNWKSYDIVLAVEFLNSVRECVDLTDELAEEVKTYYRQEEIIELTFKE